MSAAFFAMLASLLAGIGARDQAVVSAMSAKQPGRVSLVWLAVLCSCASASVAGGAAAMILPQLVPDARTMLAAIALGLAGLESLITRPARRPVEPTRSLGAFTIVVFAQQLTDSARFLVFAIAVAFAAPVAAAAGGAAGGVIVVVMAWGLPEWSSAPVVGNARRLVGAVLLVIALFMVWGAMPE